MTKEQQKQALQTWFKEVSDEIQTASFEFRDLNIPFGAGLALGVICKQYEELEKIIDDNQQKLEKIEQIVKQVESLHPEVAIGDREGIRKIREVLESEEIEKGRE